MSPTTALESKFSHSWTCESPLPINTFFLLQLPPVWEFYNRLPPQGQRVDQPTLDILSSYDLLCHSTAQQELVQQVIALLDRLVVVLMSPSLLGQFPLSESFLSPASSTVNYDWYSLRQTSIPSH